MISSFLFLTHGLIGSAVVAAGFIALCATKGSKPHTVAGKAYVLATCLMTPVVCIQSWLDPGSVSPLGIIFVLLMGYLVLTARFAMAAPAQSASKRVFSVWRFAFPLAAISIAAASVWLGLSAFHQSVPLENVPPTEAYFFFATLAFTAFCLDGLTLSQRLKSPRHRFLRHAWRMTCVLFFSTSTLFTGPGAVVLPEALHSSPWMVLPQSMVIGFAVFWIIKITLGKHHAI